MDISFGIIFGLIAMFGFGIANALVKIPTKKIGIIRTIFVRGIFSSLMLFLILLFFLPETNFDLTYIFIAVIIAIIGYIPLATFFKAIKSGKVGIITPIANSSIIFTVLLSIIFLKESLLATQILAILLIVVGIILTSINFKDLKNSNLFRLESGIPYALVSAILWGVVFFLLKIPVNVLGPILTSFIVEFGIMIFSILHIKVANDPFNFPNRKMLIHIFFIALFAIVGSLFFNLGIERSSVSIVAALTFSAPLVSTLYGKIVYKEKLTTIQYSALFLILLGVILISYF